MIQWYPGHMAKAKRKIKENLRVVDLVLEVLDARIPGSSKNPDLTNLLDGQQHLLVINKIDLAVPRLTAIWEKHYHRQALVKKINAVRGKNVKDLLKFIESEFIDDSLPKTLKIMVAGITNVGKSTLINTLAGKKKAKTGKKPGVTRGKQWIKITNNLQLLDTPGLLWPKFTEEIGYKLALTGAIGANIFDVELVAYKLIKYLIALVPGILSEKYGIGETGAVPYDILALIARKRGCLQSGGKIDRDRTARLLLSDFRQGKLGPITLEEPPENGD